MRITATGTQTTTGKRIMMDALSTDKCFCACGGGTFCLDDGRSCIAGRTTCNSCCNGYEYWFSKDASACGVEPCLIGGTECEFANTSYLQELLW
jgi:hypothetical protein